MAYNDSHRYRDDRSSSRYDPPKSPVTYPAVPRASFSSNGQFLAPETIPARSGRPRASSSSGYSASGADSRSYIRGYEQADDRAARLGIPLTEKERVWQEHLASQEADRSKRQSPPNATSSSYLQPETVPMQRTYSNPSSPSMGHARHFSTTSNVSPRASISSDMSYNSRDERDRDRNREQGPRGVSPYPSEASRPAGPTRPSQPQREPTVYESVLDKQWGRLFDADDRPTPRLGQLLRGIANHIIEVYQPENSLVITPEKLVRYYEWSNADNDDDWRRVIMSGRQHHELSVLYRDLTCEHHFVQPRHDAQPTIPGLTPRGFERWMTVQIMAYPDREVQRLQHTVQQLPINNADNLSERLPKGMSRTLFPVHGDAEYVRLIKRAFSDAELSIPVPTTERTRRRSRNDNTPPRDVRENVTIHQDRPHNNHDRQRDAQRYSATVDSGSEPESNRPDAATPIVLERERKPYVAKEGTGKNYNVEDLSDRRPAEQGHGHSSRHARASSKDVSTGQRSRDSSPRRTSKRDSYYDVSDGRRSRDTSPRRDRHHRSDDTDRGDIAESAHRRRRSKGPTSTTYHVGRSSGGFAQAVPLDAGYDRPRWADSSDDGYSRDRVRERDRERDRDRDRDRHGNARQSRHSIAEDPRLRPSGYS